MVCGRTAIKLSRTGWLLSTRLERQVTPRRHCLRSSSSNSVRLRTRFAHRLLRLGQWRVLAGTGVGQPLLPFDRLVGPLLHLDAPHRRLGRREELPCATPGSGSVAQPPWHGSHRPGYREISRTDAPSLGRRGTIAPAAVKAALRVYTGSTGYLSRVLTGAWRLDLAGDKADVVTADDEAHAKARLAERTAQKAKRAAVAASAAATLTESPAAIIAKPAPAAPIATPAPRGRIGLADLREAARRRREAAARTTGQQPSSDPLGP
jgi:ProQ/FINO family